MGANDSGQGGVGNNTGELWLPTEVRLLLAAGPSPELGISLDPTLFVSFPPAPLPCWLVGLGWLAVTTLLALAVLDRRELR